MIKKGNRE